MKVVEKIKKVKEASLKLMSVSKDERNHALLSLSDALVKNMDEILMNNQKDLQAAHKNKLKESMIDRLTLTPERILKMVSSIKEIINEKDIVGEIISESIRPNGLKIKKQRIPIGVIGMIFESRPNVIIDGAALAIKSGNAIILKGGKEAKFTNDILGDIIQSAIKKYIPEDSILVLDSTNREAVGLMLTLNKFIDLIIPRGGEKLIEFVTQNATVPVIAHYKGLCHTYVHDDANLEQAIDICLNAKVQRPGVCNAMETLLVHQKVAKDF